VIDWLYFQGYLHPEMLDECIFPSIPSDVKNAKLYKRGIYWNATQFE